MKTEVFPTTALVRRVASVATAMVLLWFAPAAGQSTSSALNGAVRAADGKPVAGAIVQARSEETGAVRTAVTAADGSYRMTSISPGLWIVAVRLPDGTTSPARSVALRLQETVRLDFAAEAGVAERVTVTAEAPLVDRRETGGKLRVSSERAAGLPLDGRAYTDLAQLDSSVRTAAPGNFYGERAGVFVVNGASGRSNTFLVDGLDNNDDTSGTSLNSFFSQQVIREFVLSTHQYAAEFGRASGGVLNIITHKGTNEFHLQGFGQGNVSEWGSSGDFIDSLPAESNVDTTSRYQAGFNFGGPFKRDRAFYFVAFEHQESDVVIPYTGFDRDSSPGGRFVAPSDDDNLFVRTDFNLSERHELMFRLSADDRTTQGVNVGGVFTPEAGFAIDERDFQLAGSYKAIVSPTLVSETRFLAASSEFAQRANSDRPGVSRPSGIFGGNALSRQLRDETKLQLLQNFTVQRGDHTLKFGVDVTRSVTDLQTAFNPNGNFLYTSDRPFEPGDCGAGASAGDAQNYLEAPANGFEAGTVIDTNGNPVCIGVPGVDDDDDGIVDEPTNIFSYPQTLTFIDGQPSAELEDTRLGVFMQDSWEVGPRLLIDYGLRYDLSTFTLPARTRVDSTVANGGAGRDNDNIAPRLGFTFTPGGNGSTVIRGGGGIFYDKLVLGFPAVSSITSGTVIQFLPTQGFAFEITEDFVDENGIDPLRPLLSSLPNLVLGFSTATELDTPYTAQFNLGVDHQIGPAAVFKANISRSQGYHLPLMKDLNPVIGLVKPGEECPATVDPTLEVGIPCHGPDSEVGSIAAITTEGRSWYWGLDLGFQAQLREGWFSASYTLSRAEDTGFDPLKGGIALPPDSVDLSLERGRSDGDRRHRVVLAGDTALPWGSFRLSGVLQWSTGLPYNVTTGKDDNFDGILTDRPEGLRRNSGSDTPIDLVNALRLEHNDTLPVDQQLAPVQGLDEPAFAQLDIRLYRPFSVGEKGAGEFYLQVFNLLDRENAGLIEGRAISRNFGRAITLAGPPRTLELGLRVGF